MLNIYLVRHGETDLNRIGVFQGTIDSKLNVTGWQQAKQAAERLSDVKIDMVFSSPLTRALQTAEVIIERCSGSNCRRIPMEICESLQELSYGDWQGIPAGRRDRHLAQEMNEWRHRPWGVRIPNGENLGALYKRVSRTIDLICARYATSIKGMASDRPFNLVICAHGHVNRMIAIHLGLFTREEFWKIKQDNGDILMLSMKTSDSTTEWLNNTISRLEPLPTGSHSASQARARVDDLLVPAGSLGRLGEIAVKLATLQDTDRPVCNKKHLIIFAADHGVTAERVSAYPAGITLGVCHSLATGSAAANVIARSAGASVSVVDVGVNGSLDDIITSPPGTPGILNMPGIIDAKIAFGTQNMAQEPAATVEQTIRAIRVGFEQVENQQDVDLLALGEVGIGNTTASAALFAALSQTDPAMVVGRGSGMGPVGMERKLSVVQRALDLHLPNIHTPLDALARLGGFEISALVGAFLGAAHYKKPVLLDGFIAAVAAYAAAALAPQARLTDYLIPSHLSAEQGHALVLQALGLEPMIAVNLRVGEGTGSLLAMPIVEAAAALLNQLHTFSDIGVSVVPDSI